MIEIFQYFNHNQVHKMRLMLDFSAFQTLMKELQTEKSKALEELQIEKSKVENIELVENNALGKCVAVILHIDWVHWLFEVTLTHSTLILYVVVNRLWYK